MTKTIKCLLIALVVFLCFFTCEEIFRRKIGGFAGSYPFAEYWDFNAPEDEVINAIIELKRENPNLQPPGQSKPVWGRSVNYDWNSAEMQKYTELASKNPTLPLPPKTESNTIVDSQCDVDFYYSDTKEVVHIFTGSRGPSDTRLVLISLNDKFINRDYWYMANRREINKFESLVVERIQKIITRNKKQLKNVLK